LLNFRGDKLNAGGVAEDNILHCLQSIGQGAYWKLIGQFGSIFFVVKCLHHPLPMWAATLTMSEPFIQVFSFYSQIFQDIDPLQRISTRIPFTAIHAQTADSRCVWNVRHIPDNALYCISPFN
jgi:hypothetical protein